VQGELQLGVGQMFKLRLSCLVDPKSAPLFQSTAFIFLVAPGLPFFIWERSLISPLPSSARTNALRSASGIIPHLGVLRTVGLGALQPGLLLSSQHKGR
jgi:hypothetical protein